METELVYKKNLTREISRLHKVPNIEHFVRIIIYEKGLDELAKLMYNKVEINDYRNFSNILRVMHLADLKFGGIFEEYEETALWIYKCSKIYSNLNNINYLYREYIKKNK